MKKYDVYELILGLACSKKSFTFSDALEYSRKIDPNINSTQIYRAIDTLAKRDIIYPKGDSFELSIK